jgi:hypothetical protein
MSKYNANGGQRRSSTARLDIPEIPRVKCILCGITESRLSIEKLKHWRMQHMHLDEDDLEFLTCAKCKTINPIVMLEMLGKVAE